ncbi:MAG: hypothetical protein KGJ98_06045 [Chloroflexota bacterium]|nr:hypothetical protein [Chloroflexota bacterium]
MDERIQRVEKLLTTPTPEFDAPAALARLRDRAARDRVVPSPRAIDRVAGLVTRPWTRPLAAALGAIVVVLALSVSGVADTILTVFEPHQIATVQISPGELSGIPDPSRYGTLTWIEKPSVHQAADAAAAGADAGFTPLLPSSLPSGVPSTARFSVMPEAKATFRFDRAKAQAAAAKVGKTAPPMPSDIAATTLTMTGGPAVVQRYGDASGATSLEGAIARNALVIVQAKAPLVTSNGATVTELRDYALAQPGVPPALAAQIRAIGDPLGTLMVPIGIDPQQAQVVTVRGTQGYVVAMGTHTAVFWLEDGYVFGATGALSQSDLIALVNGLH